MPGRASTPSGLVSLGKRRSSTKRIPVPTPATSTGFVAWRRRVIDPAEAPALPASHIVSVLGETDRWVPYDDGLEVARRWKLPAANIFSYRLGHLGMPVQLARDAAPFIRLKQILTG